jgi:hypothetical protein
MDQVRSETGDTGSVSFSDWFVRAVAKQPAGPISMSQMRGRTCHPINLGVLLNFINGHLYSAASGIETFWAEDNPYSGLVRVFWNGTEYFSGASGTLVDGYIDAAGARVFKGPFMEDGYLTKRYAIRVVQ